LDEVVMTTRFGALLAMAILTGAVLASAGAAAENFPEVDSEAFAPTQPQVPCSQRYSKPVTLGIDGEDIGTAVKDALAHLEITDAWGLDENATIVGADGSHPAVIQVTFPEGSYSPAAKDAPRGGAGFHVALPGRPRVETACLRYAVRFPAAFEWVKGGKLPGLYGGQPPSGGGDVQGDEGFSVRYMWREAGAGEAYAYVVNKPDDFGVSIGRGSWQFPTGTWTVLEQEIVLNDPSQANGVLRVWIDGRQVIEQSDIVYRTTDDITIDGLMFSTFFGGGDNSWATPLKQQIQFSDFEILLPGQL
jgi:hypothetical protein